MWAWETGLPPVGNKFRRSSVRQVNLLGAGEVNHPRLLFSIMASSRLASWLGLKRWRRGIRVSEWTAHVEWWRAPKEVVLEILNELVDQAKERLDN